MNFLVDAQRLARRLQDSGHDALHTLDLPNGNRTTDAEINHLSLKEQRIVITKDADFVNTLPYLKISATASFTDGKAKGETLSPSFISIFCEYLSAAGSR